MRRALSLLLLPLAAAFGGESPSEALPAPRWTAEIRIKLTGCISCADCRTSIRQISKAQSKSEQVDFKDGIARIVYPEPAPVLALETARALDEAELLKIDVARVDLRLGGRAEGGRFTLHATGQSWPLAPGSAEVPAGKDVVVLGSLEGWKGEDPKPSLKVRLVEP